MGSKLKTSARFFLILENIGALLNGTQAFLLIKNKNLLTNIFL
jgi:hypothetical protein